MRVLEEILADMEKVDIHDPDYFPIVEVGEDEKVQPLEMNEEYRRMYALLQKYKDEIEELDKLYKLTAEQERREKIGEQIYWKARKTQLASEMLFCSLRLEIGVVDKDVGIRKGWKVTVGPATIGFGEMTVSVGDPEVSKPDFDNIIVPENWEGKMN